jgi:hypothetical protein
MNHTLHDTAYLRLTHIIGDPSANPPIPPLIPVSKSTIFELSGDNIALRWRLDLRCIPTCTINDGRYRAGVNIAVLL